MLENNSSSTNNTGKQLGTPAPNTLSSMTTNTTTTNQGSAMKMNK